MNTQYSSTVFNEIKSSIKWNLPDNCRGNVSFNIIDGERRGVMYITYYGELDRFELLDIYSNLVRVISSYGGFSMYFEDNLDDLESSERGFRIRIQEK